jgi:hypothetical protein
MNQTKTFKLLILVWLCSCHFSAWAQTRDYRAADFQSVYISAPVSGQNLFSVLPSAPYKIRTYTAGVGYSDPLTNTETMVPGVGYIVTTNGDMATLGQTHELEDYPQTYTTGNTNTGNVYVATVANWQGLVGNPYNSFLDLDSFLLDPDNAGVIRGPIGLWNNNAAAAPVSIVPGNEQFNFSSNDYALYTVLGGVSAGRAVTANVPQNPDFFGSRPNGKLSMGTGFFVGGIANGQLAFKPSMKTNDPGLGGEQFFRQAENLQAKTTQETASTALIAPPERHRIWIDLEAGDTHAATHAYRETLVGFAAGATMAGTDRVWDAAPAPGINPTINIYSVTPETNLPLAIQGQPLKTPFDFNDFFQLGIKITTPGTYTFRADADGMFDGSPGSIPYFIQDGNILHHFPYTVNLPAGVNNTRFRVVFRAFYTELNPSFCDSQLAEIGTAFNATHINNVTTYHWKVTNLATGQIGYLDTPTLQAHLQSMTQTSSLEGNPVANDLPGNWTLPYFLTHGTVYRVEIMLLINGVWYGYGPECTLTTPPLVVGTSEPGVSCGGVLPIDGQVTCTTSSPYNYKWKVRRTSDNASISFTTTGDNSFILYGGGSPTVLNGFIRFNTEYCISVQVYYGNDAFGNEILGAAAPECCFTTQAVGGITNANQLPCGSTLPIGTQVSCPGMGANAYSWIVTRSDGQTRTFQTTASNFKLFGSAAPAILSTNNFLRYGTEYCVQVAPVYPEGIGTYTVVPCCYRTPAYTGVVSAYQGLSVTVPCGGTVAAAANYDVKTSTVYSGYTYYWKCVKTDPATGNISTVYFNTTNYYFRINTIPELVGFLNSGMWYCFSAAARYSSTPTDISNFSDACCFTINGTGYRNAGDDFNVAVTKNPSGDHFTLVTQNLSEGLVDVNVYDMLGKLLETKQVKASEAENLTIGALLPAGVYNAVITNGSNRKTIRIVKI